MNLKNELRKKFTVSIIFILIVKILIISITILKINGIYKSYQYNRQLYLEVNYINGIQVD